MMFEESIEYNVSVLAHAASVLDKHGALCEECKQGLQLLKAGRYDYPLLLRVVKQLQVCVAKVRADALLDVQALKHDLQRFAKPLRELVAYSHA
jgi:hypothetical protein